jgi:cell pole-organizing protein PopZ
MSDSSQEPTMEEILASIRRIISEDDAPESTGEAAPPQADQPPTPEPEEPVAAAPAPEPEPPEPEAPPPAPEPVAQAAEEDDDDDDDALELTQKVETHGDLDVMAAPPAPPPQEPPQPRQAAPEPKPAASTLVSAPAATAAAAAFARLTNATQMPAAGRTLEDVVREMLHPMLQAWLDENLPAIVQAAVDAEVERIARGR